MKNYFKNYFLLILCLILTSNFIKAVEYKKVPDMGTSTAISQPNDNDGDDGSIKNANYIVNFSIGGITSNAHLESIRKDGDNVFLNEYYNNGIDNEYETLAVASEILQFSASVKLKHLFSSVNSNNLRVGLGYYGYNLKFTQQAVNIKANLDSFLLKMYYDSYLNDYISVYAGMGVGITNVSISRSLYKKIRFENATTIRDIVFTNNDKLSKLHLALIPELGINVSYNRFLAGVHANYSYYYKNIDMPRLEEVIPTIGGDALPIIFPKASLRNLSHASISVTIGMFF